MSTEQNQLPRFVDLRIDPPNTPSKNDLIQWLNGTAPADPTIFTTHIPPFTLAELRSALRIALAELARTLKPAFAELVGRAALSVRHPVRVTGAAVWELDAPPFNLSARDILIPSDVIAAMTEAELRGWLEKVRGEIAWTCEALRALRRYMVEVSRDPSRHGRPNFWHLSPRP